MTLSKTSTPGPQGIWAFGMLLLGRFNFAVKASLITLVLTVPLIYVLFDVYNSRMAVIDFAAKERVGVGHLQAFAGVPRLEQEAADCRHLLELLIGRTVDAVVLVDRRAVGQRRASGHGSGRTDDA